MGYETHNLDNYVENHDSISLKACLPEWFVAGPKRLLTGLDLSFPLALPEIHFGSSWLLLGWDL